MKWRAGSVRATAGRAGPRRSAVVARRAAGVWAIPGPCRPIRRRLSPGGQVPCRVARAAGARGGLGRGGLGGGQVSLRFRRD